MKALIRLALLCLVLATAFSQKASANLVQNANFNTVMYSGTLPLTTVFGQFGTGTGRTLTVANWTTTGYNFVYAPGTADSGKSASGANASQPNEAPGQYNTSAGYGNTYMYGPNNGSANGLPAAPPSGNNNFLALDGAFNVGAVTQTITGLTVGQTLQLKFNWAGVQQESFSGTTSEKFTVTLGSQAFTTGTTFIASKGFSGWMSQTFTYTATATSETLSFLAGGTPNGQPPFSLLDGVDLEIVPDFSNWMVFACFGTACVVFEGWRRRGRRASLFGSPPGG